MPLALSEMCSHFDFPLPPAAHASASSLLLRLTFAAQFQGYEVNIQSKPGGNHLTHFLLNVKMVPGARSGGNVQFGVTEYSKTKRRLPPRMYVRTRPAHMDEAIRLARSLWHMVDGKELLYDVDCYTNQVRWRLGELTGAVDAFEVIHTVNPCTREETWHVFDFQNDGVGTVLHPGFFDL